MKFSKTALVASTLAGVLIVAGCGAKSPSNASSNASSQGSTSTQKVSLRFLFPALTGTDVAWSNALKAAVAKKYPNITINYMTMNWTALENKLGIMVKSHDYPDVSLTQDVTNLVGMNALTPLNNYMKNDPVLNTSNFAPSFLDYSKMNGKIYSIPLAGIDYGLAVNKNMLAAVGLKPSDLKTWSDFLKAAKLMTANGHYGYAIAAGKPRFAFRNAEIVGLSDGLIPSDTSSASKSKYMALLNMYKSLIPYTPPSDVSWSYPELFKAYCNGEVGMIATGSYFTANVYGINPNIIKDTVVIPFPKGPSQSKPVSMVSNVGMAIVQGSKNPAAAWDVIKVAESDALAAQFAGAVNLPARSNVPASMIQAASKKAYPKAYKAHAALVSEWEQIAQKYGTPMPKIVGQPQMEVAFQGAFVKFLQGSASAASTYQQITSQIKAIKSSN